MGDDKSTVCLTHSSLQKLERIFKMASASTRKEGNLEDAWADDEEEEEEQLVMVELTGIIDSDILKKCDKKCKILGINTEKPFLQVDTYVFAGEYEDALGTCVIFEEDPDNVDEDDKKPKLKYKCHTVKKLNMTRTFLTEKKEGDEGGGRIEWFHIKDGSSSSWPTMICSFAQENEEAEDGGDDSQSDEEQELNGSNEDSGHLVHNFVMDKQDTEMKEKHGNETQGMLELGKEERQGFELQEKQVPEKKERQNSEPEGNLESDKHEMQDSESEGKLESNEQERQDSESERKLQSNEQERQDSECIGKLQSNDQEG
ncbi:general transcription factor IIIC subunit 6 L homeolog isoform X2 [Xenopus laevis]|nr:general transcription factor IIIC subunit 6 L homeolog isoform X2 [Xenopus laevis]XP_018112187.1 general transcription factor IIIC subunit 6 L homeolog isoform X2 [Xenopus laevis]XP_018112188.1 general transcription factor IIIC subunit 6 L homeolog isoform X2 [Xenopus laevis]OCT84341.1 hypothetical protein XELAEV_18022491mg [Xenopus laevis]